MRILVCMAMLVLMSMASAATPRTVYVESYGHTIAELHEGTIVYLHDDYLKSTRVQTDASGTASKTIEYSPYGATTDAGITYGGEHAEEATDTIDLGARLYTADEARFFVPDAVMPDTGSPYVYSHNNPSKFSDPSGNTAEMVLQPFMASASQLSAGGMLEAVAASVSVFSLALAMVAVTPSDIAMDEYYPIHVSQGDQETYPDIREVFPELTKSLPTPELVDDGTSYVNPGIDAESAGAIGDGVYERFRGGEVITPIDYPVPGPLDGAQVNIIVSDVMRTKYIPPQVIGNTIEWVGEHKTVGTGYRDGLVVVPLTVVNSEYDRLRLGARKVGLTAGQVKDLVAGAIAFAVSKALENDETDGWDILPNQAPPDN